MTHRLDKTQPRVSIDSVQHSNYTRDVAKQDVGHGAQGTPPALSTVKRGKGKEGR